MNRTLLILAILVGAAGSAVAQTSAPSVAPPNMANASGLQLSRQAFTAEKAIERDGYKNVQGLAKGSDGLWHAQAKRGNMQVQVTVDHTGTVSAR